MLENGLHLASGHWRATVLPGFGANTVRLRYKDQEILRCPDRIEHLMANPHVYGMPLLFPPNRVEDGTFDFDGRTYRLEINEPKNSNHIHGGMADAPFTIVRASGNEAVCEYENRGERYPFPFRMTVSASLNEDGFRQEIAILNSGDTDMPVMLGIHTTFAEPSSFRVPIGQRWATNDRHLPTGRMLELTEREREYREGCRTGGEPISGYYTATEQEAKIGGFSYCTSDHFTQWVLFNGGGGKGFLCVEPQSGPVNGLNRSDGYLRLKIGESARFWTAVSREGA
ncbi:aldose 1-epimerase [Cohnella cholangitidis]|uniref:Aldose 1-epimerase n=1 Tax=Cohnella cholangitidis TaxID=2598458 RepID=A0A7G5BWG5_9BACL|nr:aldose 1-epimerase [Cohnella cholangitidis]QMV41299.1 aldose 1-epimerase [Cohnella cholangitidis]